MSFMNGGSECSTASNPLSQFTKHAGEDRSLQFDRMRPGSGQGQQMRSDFRTMNQEDQRMMDQFSSQNVGPNHFAFDSKMGPSPQAPVQHNNWAQDFHNKGKTPISQVPQGNINMGANNQWAGEFRHSVSPDQQQQQQHHPAQQQQYRSQYTPMYAGMASGGMMGPGMMGGQFYQQQNLQQNQPQNQDSRIVQLDDDKWEEQFRALELNKDQQDQQETSEKDKEDAEQAKKELEDHFENVWERIKGQVLDNAEEWATTDGPAWDRDFDEFTTHRPQFGDYQFEENNPYMAEDDPFALGVELMDRGAKLSLAVLCFEAAVQKNADHVAAWERLGAAQQQNEKEDPAIRALERCVKIDPNNLAALLNLSVSYTNEGYENAAYATLEKWIATKYPDICSQARTQEPRLENEDRFQLHNRVTELFIRAAQISPDGANMDADVQVGLGVLFYGNEDFEKAVDCFNAALAVRPNDYLLWNRLGATLANSSRSEEAIDAYYKALEIKPSFVRARYNLGVSCINIGCYKEAAQHLLSALSLHKTEGPDDELLANQSTNLYETLRRVFLAMDRRDLLEKVGSGMNVDDFRGEFDF